jgi:hypothetical protein
MTLQQGNRILRESFRTLKLTTRQDIEWAVRLRANTGTEKQPERNRRISSFRTPDES